MASFGSFRKGSSRDSSSFECLRFSMLGCSRCRHRGLDSAGRCADMAEAGWCLPWVHAKRIAGQARWGRSVAWKVRSYTPSTANPAVC